MLHLILILLGLAAVYCGVAWVYTFIATRRLEQPIDEQLRAAIELFTFHLGLCFIIAIGFAGLILVLGGH